MKLYKESLSSNYRSNEKKRASTVLISGGSGLVGRYLTSLLLSKGYTVSHLSRKSSQFGKVRVYRWDPAKGIIDPHNLEGVDYIVHLSGANIGEKRWSKARKREIVSSRVDSAKLLFKVIHENDIKPRAFVSASATGYYGSVTSDRIFSEKDSPADDFLGTTCRLWEEAAEEFEELGIRTVKIRTAVVIEKSDSALAKLLIPARFGIFPVLGSGNQYMPWIHIEDLCNIYLKAIQDDNMKGAYNAVAPQQVTQKEFMGALAEAMNKRFFHPPVPSLILKVMLGEMSDLVLKGSRASAEKIMNTGYNYLYPDLEASLKKS